jgi:hypothetical protein
MVNFLEEYSFLNHIMTKSESPKICMLVNPYSPVRVKVNFRAIATQLGY